MKIFDCFMYFDEDLLLDLRLNILNDFVDKFIIIESNLTHTGKFKKLKFDINKFEKFKHKISYYPQSFFCTIYTLKLSLSLFFLYPYSILLSHFHNQIFIDF